MNKLFGFIALSMILSLLNQGYSQPILEETEDEIIMQNSWIQVEISKDNGVISSLVYLYPARNINLLTKSAFLIIRDIQNNVEYEQTDGTVSEYSTETYQDSVKAIFNIVFSYEPPPPEDAYSVQITYTLYYRELYWDAVLQTGFSSDRESNIDFSFPVIANMKNVLWSRKDAPFKLPIRRTVTYRKKAQHYYWPVTIPAMILYNDSTDIGFSIVSPFDLKKPGLEWQMMNDTFIISNYYLRLSQQHPAQAALYIVPHEGCWRPGFAWMHDKYSNYFDPICDTVLQGEGWHKIINPTTSCEEISTLKQQGVTWVEFHSHFPFYGLYTPLDRNTWKLIIDRDDISYNQWAIDSPPFLAESTSYDTNNELINFCRDSSIQNYIYFQPSESWKQYTAEIFPFQFAIGSDGLPIPAWKYCYLMNPDPDTSWGKYIISQLNTLLAKYPNVNGIFYDRVDYCDYAYNYNDSITMIDSHPVYMLGFAQEKIRDIILDTVHNRGKGAWANWPTSIEVAKGMDGIMSEDVGVAPYLQYLGITRPLILPTMYPGDVTPQLTEEKLKTALYTGHFPSATYGGDSCKDLDGRYRPLFATYKGKKWVLHSHALQLPEGIKGNIFQTPDTDYLVPMVDLERYSIKVYPETTHDIFRYDIFPRIRVPDSLEIKYCYILSGDYKGINQDTVYTNNNNEKRTHAHRVSSLVQLSKKPKYEITRISSPVLVRGDSEEFVIRVQNIDEVQKPYNVQLKTPFGSTSVYLELDPGQFENVGLDFVVDENFPLVETTDTVIINDSTIIFTSWITDFVQFDVPESILFIHYIQGETIPFTLINNIEDTLKVTLNGNFLAGTGTIFFPETIPTLKPLEAKELKVLIKPIEETDTVEIIASAGNDTVKIIRLVERTMSLEDTLNLFVDNFSTGDMDNWDIISDTCSWKVVDSVARGNKGWHLAWADTSGSLEESWTDYKFQVNTKLAGSTAPFKDWYESFIFFRYQDSNGDMDSSYRFGIAGSYGPSNAIVLGVQKGDTWTMLASTPFKAKKNVMYNLRVEVKGDSIKGFVDGNQLISVKDTVFTSGIIGIGVPWDSMVTYYDDVVVRRIPE